MSDQERGPYTPQREQPLQFDARRARDARPMPMTLIGSAVVLVVLIGAVVMAYTGGFGHKDSAPKTVGQPVGSLKSSPPAEAAPETPPKLEVLSDKPAPSTPTFAPEPEKPAPRPTLQVRSSTLPPVHIAPADEPAAGSTAKAAGAAATAVPSTRTATQTATVKTETATAAKTTTPKAESAAATVATGSVGAQIGAFSSRELADKGFADVGKLASTAGRGKKVEAVEKGDSTLYRTTVTGFPDRDAAKAFCAAIAAKGHAGCFVKG